MFLVPLALPDITPMKTKLKVRTLILSDVHLGTPDCKIQQVNHLLRHVECEKLILNGDIIDGWYLARSGGWSKAHTYFLRLILKRLEKFGTEVVYLRGNHDDILWRFLPMKFDNLSIVNEHIHESKSGKYLVIHGDGFDSVTTNMQWLAKLGSVGYELLLRLNRIGNWFRRRSGVSGFSLSKYIKARVKSAVNFISNFEEQLQQFAELKGCNGIICGHIHTPADKSIGGIHYLNSGDWVESMTAIIERVDHTFEIITYEDFCRMTEREPKGTSVAKPLSGANQGKKSAPPTVDAPVTPAGPVIPDVAEGGEIPADQPSNQLLSV
jgi:UDP-2,3-diacylglucosamine pyrophosphatase LpxH